MIFKSNDTSQYQQNDQLLLQPSNSTKKMNQIYLLVDLKPKVSSFRFEILSGKAKVKKDTSIILQCFKILLMVRKE